MLKLYMLNFVLLFASLAGLIVIDDAHKWWALAHFLISAISVPVLAYACAKEQDKNAARSKKK